MFVIFEIVSPSLSLPVEVFLSREAAEAELVEVIDGGSSERYVMEEVPADYDPEFASI